MAQALAMPPLGLKLTTPPPEPAAPPAAALAPAPAGPSAPPTLVLPIAMQPRVKIAPGGATKAPGREPGHAAATLSESGLRTSQDLAAARMKTIEEAEDTPDTDHAVSAFGALAMSVIGLFAWPLILGVASLCMGVWALSEMRVTGNHGGRKPALLGIVLGLVNVGFWVFYAMARVSESLAT